MRADLPGVATEFVDGFGNQRYLTEATAAALRVALRLEEPETGGLDAVRVISQGHSIDLGGSGTIALEDGSTRHVDQYSPADLPLGYHNFQRHDGSPSIRLIIAPESCKPLEDRIWGWAVQLYAVRSAASWGIGDLGDLRQLGEWSAKLGARMLQINPLGAATPGLPQATSPYYPSSRRFLNPLYLRIEALPHIERVQSLCDGAGEQARQLNQQRLIDRDAIYRLKMHVLEALWEVVRHDLSNCAYYFSNQAETLQRFATFCALAEQFGQNWRDWPEEFQHPQREEVARFAVEHDVRVRFHMWLQYLLDRQLQHAAEAIPLVFDLPVGVDPGGVDAWCWQDALALGSRVGAPPDEFNASGQDWGLPPWIPRKMIAAQYEPFIQTVRASLKYAGGLRIDHVMGLFRLYWIPQSVPATEGTYVDLPSADLLGILALESQRAGAWIAGEDLGTVPSGMRGELDRFRILSHRLVWFEGTLPQDYPDNTVAAITTHDLPTVAGVWTGEDLAAEKRIGRPVREESFREIRGRLQWVAGIDEHAATEDAVRAAYRALGKSPSRVRLASLEDVLLVTERPNMPGTVHEWPNWCLALPEPLEVIQSAPLAKEIAEAMS